MDNDKGSRFWEGFLTGAFVWLSVGFIMSLFFARHIWVDYAAYYDEVHYKYTHCPYCGEELEGR